MYRLSDIEDTVLQRIVTKEIIHGFTECFTIDPASGRANQDASVFFFKHILHLTLKSDKDEENACRFIEKLYQELCDQNNEYTFNEFGEYLLYKASEDAWNISLENVQTAEGISEQILSSPEKCIPLWWEPSALKEEQTYVRRYGRHLYLENLEEEKEDEEITPETDDDLWNQAEKFVQRCLYFPFMHTELNDEIPLLFWDEDFLLIQEYGETEFRKIRSSTIGASLGMAQEEENTEPFSGSYRFPLHRYH